MWTELKDKEKRKCQLVCRCQNPLKEEYFVRLVAYIFRPAQGEDEGE